MFTIIYLISFKLPCSDGSTTFAHKNWSNSHNILVKLVKIVLSRLKITYFSPFFSWSRPNSWSKCSYPPPPSWIGQEPSLYILWGFTHQGFRYAENVDSHISSVRKNHDPKYPFCDKYREKHMYSFKMITMKSLTLFKKASTKGDFYQSSIHVWDHGI